MRPRRSERCHPMLCFTLLMQIVRLVIEILLDGSNGPTNPANSGGS